MRAKGKSIAAMQRDLGLSRSHLGNATNTHGVLRYDVIKHIADFCGYSKTEFSKLTTLWIRDQLKVGAKGAAGSVAIDELEARLSEREFANVIDKIVEAYVEASARHRK